MLAYIICAIVMPDEPKAPQGFEQPQQNFNQQDGAYTNYNPVDLQN